MVNVFFGFIRIKIEIFSIFVAGTVLDLYCIMPKWELINCKDHNNMSLSKESHLRSYNIKLIFFFLTMIKGVWVSLIKNKLLKNL